MTSCTLDTFTINARGLRVEEAAGGLAGGEEGAGQVDGEDPLPFVERHLDERVGALDARVVDEHVDRAAELRAR